MQKLSSDCREAIISRIEGYFGVLETIQYQHVSDEDLKTIYYTLLECNQIRQLKDPYHNQVCEK